MKIEEKMKDDNRRYGWRAVLLALFLIVMAMGFIMGCVLFMLRPTESVLEKRELTKFPEFKTEEFIDGTYTNNVEKWFSDTFPFREELLTIEGKIKTYYGLQNDVIANYGDGDEIPDIEDLTQATETEPPETESDPGIEVITESEPESESESERETYESVDADELVRMNPQEAGDVNVKDLVGYCVYGFNLQGADKYAIHVSNVANALHGVSDVYEILIPDNSAIMLDEETKKAWKLSDEEKVIHYYQAKAMSLSPYLKDVYIYDTLMEHNDEYLYFKTDHHWTQLGAYYAYVEFCKAKGIEPHDLSEYKEIVTENFLGSYYQANGYTQLADNPDTVYAYEPLTCNDMKFYDNSQKTMRNGYIVRDMNAFGPTLKFYGFIYGDNPLTVIESPEVHNGEKCIVIKESFGNCWVPFLTDHYEKIYILDYRTYNSENGSFIGNVVDLAKEENVTDVVFINNLEAISASWIMDVMGNICK
ncbi:MAG: hypothetical protein IJL78_08625 [Lachnospiraceae bacterium]|nr:hypothetical protein [Lachnospiraceae bacterium]